jgi:hypothetical protein
VTAREGRPRQSVLQKSVFGNAVSRSKTGASRPEGIRSDLSTAGPKLAEHNDCERAAKENDTEGTSPPGYRREPTWRTNTAVGVSSVKKSGAVAGALVAISEARFLLHSDAFAYKKAAKTGRAWGRISSGQGRPPGSSTLSRTDDNAPLVKWSR